MKENNSAILLFCMSLVLAIALFGCGDNTEPISMQSTDTPEQAAPITPKPTSQKHTEQSPPEPTPFKPIEEPSQEPSSSESTESIMSAADAQIIISEWLEGLHKISYMPDLNKEERDVLYYRFSVDYSGWVTSNSHKSIAYAWVNSVTGDVNFEECYLYANIPDSRFPVPMRNGTIIPYDRYSPPDYTQNGTYGYNDRSVIEIYEAQLKEAGFHYYGQVLTGVFVWESGRYDDGYILWVEIREGDNRVSICLYISD